MTGRGGRDGRVAIVMGASAEPPHDVLTWRMVA